MSISYIYLEMELRLVLELLKTLGPPPEKITHKADNGFQMKFPEGQVKSTVMSSFCSLLLRVQLWKGKTGQSVGTRLTAQGQSDVKQQDSSGTWISC